MICVETPDDWGLKAGMNELAELFRNAIELNRYSNSVSRRIIESYNDRVLDAIDELSVADGLSGADQAENSRRFSKN